MRFQCLCERRFWRSLRTYSAAVIVFAILPPADLGAVPASRELRNAEFAQKLADLATKCDELTLPDQAALTRRWIIPLHSGRQYFFVPETDSTDSAKSAPQVVQQWRTKFLE